MVALSTPKRRRKRKRGNTVKSFSEWRAERLDEAKRSGGKKADSRSYVRPDMDRWIKAIEALAKDLDELKQVKKKAESRKKMQSLAQRVLRDEDKPKAKETEEKRSDERKPEQDAKEKTQTPKDERPKPEPKRPDKDQRSKPQIQGKVKRYGNQQRNRRGGR